MSIYGVVPRLTAQDAKALRSRLGASEASQKLHVAPRGTSGAPGGSRGRRSPPWGTWSPGDGPATRQGRAEQAIETGMLESEARALLDQLQDYQRNWPELAGDFERRNAAALAAARNIVGPTGPREDQVT